MAPLIKSENGNVEVDHEPGTVVLDVGNTQERAQIALEPSEAAELARVLTEEAQNAIHAERLGRRKS